MKNSGLRASGGGGVCHLMLLVVFGPMIKRLYDLNYHIAWLEARGFEVLYI